VALGPTSEPYRSYEWAGLFTSVWSGTLRIGLPELDTHSCQADLSIEPGPLTASESTGVLRDLSKRFFAPAALPALLDGLVRLQLAPKASRRTTHCPRRIATRS
jgi:hypothetical protein